MPSIELHLGKANQFQIRLSQLLEAKPFMGDLAAITAFYKAVHIAEALFAHRENLHSTNHGERNHRLKRSYPVIWRPYYNLYRASLFARYMQASSTGSSSVYATFESFLPDSTIRSDLLGRNLVGVESEAVNLLPDNPMLDRYIVVQPKPDPPATPAAARFATSPTSRRS